MNLQQILLIFLSSSSKNDSNLHRRSRSLVVFVLQVQMQLLVSQRRGRTVTVAHFWQFTRLCRDEKEAFWRNLQRHLSVRVNLNLFLTFFCNNLINFRAYPTARYVGIYKMEMPALLIRDLDLIKDILVTNFNAFNMNEFSIDPKVSLIKNYLKNEGNF